jgi:hypothetical protein
MSLYKRPEESIPTHTDEYYEELASQEELYLEEMEEEVHAILTSYVSSATGDVRSTVTEYCGFRESDLEIRAALTDPRDDRRMAESLDEQLVEASEELITGDADDPPLTEEAVVEILSDSRAQRLGSAS